MVNCIETFLNVKRAVSYRIVSYSIASHRIASHRIASHRIASHRIASHRIASYRIVSYRIVSHRIVSYRIVSYRIVLYCIVLYCIVLYCKYHQGVHENWRLMSMYLSDNIETIQKRCLRTIFPGHSYDEARSISNLPSLFERRTKLCQSYFRKMHNADHKLNKLLPNQRNISYDLRTYNTLPVSLATTDRFRRSLIPWGLANWQHNVL